MDSDAKELMHVREAAGKTARRHRTGVSREQMSLRLAGYPKTPRLRRPIWVTSGHSGVSGARPLYPQKRTLLRVIGMSALCQKRTRALQQPTPAISAVNG